MSSIADLVAFDGASTPVSHTFKALSVAKDGKRILASYRESIAGVPVYAQARVTVYQDEVTTNGIYRNGVLVEVPVMETVTNANAAGYTAAPKVAHVVSSRHEFLTHERSDVTIRRLARQLAVNIANGVTATATPVTTGPVPELFDQLVMPT